ncbi:hypothetical protein ACR56S_07750 [Staphylococcus hominis]|uniref:hypothetical protein n=1 Tax=Staphylococcus hominis TaxID=1290 RepID=UPI003D9FCA14
MAEDPKFVVHGSQVQKWTDDIQQLKQERDAYKKQRDELINDMAEVKRKAEILDKLEEMFETSANANRKHGFNGGAEFYERYLDIIRERGSDE